MTDFNTNLGSGGPAFAADTEGASNWVVNKMGWGAAGSGQRVTLLQPFPVQPAATSFVFSPTTSGNSTTTQLAAGTTFTGTVESTSSQQCISVLLTSDQPGTLTVNQFIDSGGVFRTNTWTYPITAGVPFSRNLTANGNYAQVLFKNTGASTTTTLNLNTAYGTLPAVVDDGSMPVTDTMVATNYSVAGVIAINTVLTTIDCTSDASVSVQCVAMGTTGVVTPEWSNDGTNWIAATNFMTQAGVAAATLTAAGLWTAQVMARYLRLRLSTATTAGTTTFAVQSIAPTIGAIQAQPVTMSTLNTVSTVNTLAAISAGTTLIGDVGIQVRANATGAATPISILSPVTPIGASIKGSAGRLFGWQLVNNSAALRSVKFYNATAVTMGTTAALFEVDLAAGQQSLFELPAGIAFATGIMWAVTGAKGLTDNTTTGLAVNDVSGSAFFA